MTIVQNSATPGINVFALMAFLLGTSFFSKPKPKPRHYGAVNMAKSMGNTDLGGKMYEDCSTNVQSVQSTHRAASNVAGQYIDNGSADVSGGFTELQCQLLMKMI